MELHTSDSELVLRTALRLHADHENVKNLLILLEFHLVCGKPDHCCAVCLRETDPLCGIVVEGLQKTRNLSYEFVSYLDEGRLAAWFGCIGSGRWSLLSQDPAKEPRLWTHTVEKLQWVVQVLFKMLRFCAPVLGTKIASWCKNS